MLQYIRSFRGNFSLPRCLLTSWPPRQGGSGCPTSVFHIPNHQSLGWSWFITGWKTTTPGCAFGNAKANCRQAQVPVELNAGNLETAWSRTLPARHKHSSLSRKGKSNHCTTSFSDGFTVPLLGPLTTKQAKWSMRFRLWPLLQLKMGLLHVALTWGSLIGSIINLKAQSL